MAARPSVDHDIAGWLRQRLEEASPDLLREMVQRRRLRSCTGRRCG